MFPHDREIILQQQIIVAMDTARQGIFYRDYAVVARASSNSDENIIEGFARNRGHFSPEMLRHRRFGIGPRLPLKSDPHATSVTGHEPSGPAALSSSASSSNISAKATRA